MGLTVLGGCGAWPEPGQACSGFLLEHDGFRLAEATYVDGVPDDARAYLSSARQAGELAARAGAGRLLLTHLWPGTSHGAAVAAAADGYPGPVSVATPGRRLDLTS